MRPGTRLLSGFLLLGVLALAVLAARTYEAPWVPPLGEMAEQTAAAVRLRERCERSGGGLKGGGTVTCYWTLELADRTILSWPWPDPSGGVAGVDRYLRENGPITVRHWQGTVYQIVTNDGHPYLEYSDAAGWERFRQRIWIWAGVLVAALGTARVALEVVRLQSVVSPGRWQGTANVLDGVTLYGGLILPLAGTDRIWWAVMALGAFGAAGSRLSRIVPAGGRSTCEPMAYGRTAAMTRR